MKAFSIGLNLDADIDELKSFFNKNAGLLCSVYFSLPLGKPYYTRGGLEIEYKDADKKLLRVVDIIKEAGIRTEIALNTRLSEEQLKIAIEYIERNHLTSDEIACRNSSFPLLHSAFPKCEFISCYNNGDEDILPDFDSIVLGQDYLRNPSKRQKWEEKGFRIILLLNNGCSFLCDPRFCNQDKCCGLYKITNRQLTVSQIYALQSFFPEELRALSMNSSFFSYRFKLSTRPLGLQYTRDVLRNYALVVSSSEELFLDNQNNYLLFGALTLLANNFKDMNYKEIIDYKRRLSPLCDIVCDIK